MSTDMDAVTFEQMVSPHRAALHAHCYRMLGSVHDADDALQETLLAAWRGLHGYEGRAPFGHWLHRIATHASLRLASRRSRRILSEAYSPSRTDVGDLGEIVAGSVWIEPYPDIALFDTATDPAARYDQLESLELAFITALQLLPPSQRAALLLKDVLGYRSVEVAHILEVTPAAVNSALQRARSTLAQHSATSQQDELRIMGDAAAQQLVAAFADAWQRGDVHALVALFTDDVRFSMPPLPAWFQGIEAVSHFFTERIFATTWHLEPITANGQLGNICNQSTDGGRSFSVGAINVLTVRDGRIAAIHGFVDGAIREAAPRFLPLNR